MPQRQIDRDQCLPPAASGALWLPHCLAVDGNVIRFIPPLVTTIDELDRAIDTIDDALTEYEAR